MKITELNLLAFGPFDGMRLDLSGGNQGFHFIYGPNEAGKSSALRALRAAFYGIPVRSPDNFRHPYNKLRIGATVRHSSGAELTFIRRKGAKNTLRSKTDDSILDDSVLDPFLNGMDESLFSTMFGIDHGDLVRGGKEILSGGGSLGQLIFAAGSGISGLRNIQTQLQKDADALFKPSGKNPPINQAILRVRENRKALRDIQLASSDWERHDKALTKALEQKQATEQQLTEAQAEKNRLERIREAFPLIARRKKLADDLAAYGSVVILPETFTSQRRELMSKLKIAARERQQAAEAISQIREEIDRIDFSDRIINNAFEIESIYQQLGSYIKAAGDRTPLETRMDILRSEAKEILHTLRKDLTIDQADQLRMTKKETLHIQELGSRYERIVTRMQSLRDEIPKLSRHIEKIDNQLADLPTPCDVGEVIFAVEQAADLAPVEQECLDEIKAFDQEQSAMALELDRLPYWSGSIEDIEKLSLPPVETIDRFENDFEDINRKIQKNKDDLKQLKNRLADVIQKAKEMTLNFSVPQESDLLSLREKRDALWRIISEIVENPNNKNIRIMEFQRQFPEETDLNSAFENSMHSADHLADRLRREADRVATLAKLVSERSDIEAAIQRLDEEKKTYGRMREKISSNWTGQWKAADISPATPREMRAWTNRMTELIARYAEINKQMSRLQAKHKKIQQIRDHLLNVLKSVNEPVPNPGATLSELIKRARKRIENENRRHDQREKILAEKSQMESQLSDLQIRYQRAEQEMALWQQQWETAVSPLGLDAGSMPAHAGAFLEDLKVLFEKLKEADILNKRITGIDRDAAAFKSSVNKLAAVVAPQVKTLPPEQAAAEMMQMLNKHRSAQSKIQTLEKQLHREKLRLDRSEKAFHDAESVLKTMCEEARCDNYQQLPEAEARSGKKRELESALEAVETQMLKMSAGMCLEDFVTECLAQDPDRIQSKIDALTETIDCLSQKKSELDQRIGSERNELAKMDGSGRAASIAEDTQIILGGLEHRIEAYARCKIASAVLNLAIERFRDRHQSPILEKSGALFSQITGGSFDGIRAEFDDAGNPVIVGVRDAGREIVRVEGMSEGTADQLYLSLRLAGIGEYLEKNEPIPFIIDDILIKFDNSRALAALKVLAKLSAKTQVIFFTHHHHLLELAKSHIDPSVLFCHFLGPCP